MEMTQALQLLETRWEPVGPDMLLTGYLPASGGLHALHAELIGGSQPAVADSAPSFAAAPSSSRSDSSTPASAQTAIHSANGAASPAAYAVPLLRPSHRRTSSPQVRCGVDQMCRLAMSSVPIANLLCISGYMCCFE